MSLFLNLFLDKTRKIFNSIFEKKITTQIEYPLNVSLPPSLLSAISILSKKMYDFFPRRDSNPDLQLRRQLFFHIELRGHIIISHDISFFLCYHQELCLFLHCRLDNWERNSFFFFFKECKYMEEKKYYPRRGSNPGRPLRRQLFFHLNYAGLLMMYFSFDAHFLLLHFFCFISFFLILLFRLRALLLFVLFFFLSYLCMRGFYLSLFSFHNHYLCLCLTPSRT